MKRWMKRNIIIFTINWWAKLSSPAFLLIALSLSILSCKKDNDFNLGSKTSSSDGGVLYTDTLTLINKTFLINDSIISASAGFMAFGGYNDTYTGKLYAEAYCTLNLYQQFIDYSGIQADSANLYLTYVDQYGDSLIGQDIGVHQITTQLDAAVPYQPTTNFITYNSTLVGEKAGFKPAGHMITGDHNVVSIPLTQTFANSLLSYADDKDNTDFNTSFYGIVIRPKNNSVGAVINAVYSGGYDIDTLNTRICVYFKIGLVRDSAVFYLYRTPGFNKMIADRSGTTIASLQNTRQSISDANTNQKCFVQSGTGIVTKVEMPNLSKFSGTGDSAIILNKAVLVAYLDDASDLTKFRPITQLELLQLNPDNTYKYAITGNLAYIQNSAYNQLSTGYPTFDTITSTYKKQYLFDITAYAQSIIYDKVVNNGFIITPILNAYSTSRVVFNSYNASTKPMRLEIYYTKVKH